MRKFLIVISLFALTPVVIWAHKPIKTAINEWHFRNNADRTCEMRADPVRFVINDILFSVPTNVFGRGGLLQCDYDAFGRQKNCTKNHQSAKSFKTDKGEVYGLCQAKDDPPFLITWTYLRFGKNKNDGSHFTLKAEGKPPINAKIEELIINNDTVRIKKEICKHPSEIKFFGNPVIIECTEDRRDPKYKVSGRLCSFTGLIGSNIKVYQNQRFEEDKITMEYWPAYTEQLEKLMRTYLPTVPSEGYPRFCEKDK